MGHLFLPSNCRTCDYNLLKIALYISLKLWYHFGMESAKKLNLWDIFCIATGTIVLSGMFGGLAGWFSFCIIFVFAGSISQRH